MSNDITNPPEDFDLFAKDVEDNLQEQLAKGSYKWTNKYTAVLGVLVIITASVSGGIWYGNKHAASSTSNAFAGFASRLRGAAAGGAFTGAAGATGSSALPDPAAIAAAAGAGGFGGGGFGGGTRLSGTITKVNGTTVTITLDSPPSTPIASGDAVSIRDTGAAGAAGAAAGGAAAPSTGKGRARGSGSASVAPTTPAAPGAAGNSTAKPSVGGAAGAPGGGGGRFNNPEFTACLAKNGVTLAAGARPDRTDPKIAAAMQACFSTLGLPGGAPGGAGGFGGGARPAPTSTP